MTDVPYQYGDPGGNAAFHGGDTPHLHSFDLVDTIIVDEDDGPYGVCIYVRMCRHCDEIFEVLHAPGSTLIAEAEDD